MNDASTTSTSEAQESSLVQLPVSAMAQTTDDDVIEDVEDADSEDSLTFSNGEIGRAHV